MPRAALPAYPHTSETNVPWMGRIPSHWQKVALRRLVTCLDGRRVPLNSEQRAWRRGPYPYWGANCVLDQVDEWLFDEELVLLGEDGAPFFDSLKPVACAISGRIWVNNHAHVLRAKPGVDHRFLAHALNAVDYREYIQGSTRDKLTQSQMNVIGLPLVPHREQRLIADYLDRETGQIDRLIEKQERLIERMEEKRRAVISQAVTQGLNPNMKMTDSKNTWLGLIPCHWRLERARWLFRQLSLPPKAGDGVVTAFRDGQVTLRENRRTEGYTFAFKETGYQHVRVGDLVIHSMDAFAGAIGVSESYGKCTGEYVVCQPRAPGLNNTYYAHVLRRMALNDYVRVVCPAVRQRAPRFRFVRLKDVLLPVPPAEEQDAIVEYLTRETARIDAVALKTQALIDRLREKKAALISAAVTGRIDVRGGT